MISYIPPHLFFFSFIHLSGAGPRRSRAKKRALLKYEAIRVRSKSYLYLSYLVSSCPFLFICCLISFFLSSWVMQDLILSHSVILHHMILYDMILYIITYHIMSYYIISCHITSYYLISYNMLSYQVVLCQY